MKLGDVMKIRGTLFKHKDEKASQVPIAVKYKISKFLYDTDDDAIFFEKQISALREQYSDKSDQKDELNEKIKELLETEVDKEIKFTLDEIENFDLTIDDMIQLDKCIIEKREGA